ncbi:MAG: non-canonical purine NTP pyrophosphatase [Patescibacteria group bacterium]|nr:non-canonical purine NTP pyrophosphatase [Patescibacteria group bacterium]MDE2438141.1 non-canonical purine NTP pyrophosphatase [Patescibacteria group bacterium]
MKQIVFATGNHSKLAQIRFVAGHYDIPIEIINGKETYGDNASYEEIGDNVSDVARNGAIMVAKRIGVPVITEDTDFRVDALGGIPGIHAGAFLKQYGRGEILYRMRDVKNRNAAIRSAVAYATPEGTCNVFHRTIEGHIAHEEHYGDYPDWIAPNEHNAYGGGYNAIFIPQDREKTLAEISPEEAMPWSYREQNFVNVLTYIIGLPE